MSRFSSLGPTFSGEAYGNGRQIDLELAVARDPWEVRVDLYDPRGAVSDVVLSREQAVDLARLLLSAAGAS